MPANLEDMSVAQLLIVSANILVQIRSKMEQEYAGNQQMAEMVQAIEEAAGQVNAVIKATEETDPNMQQNQEQAPPAPPQPPQE